MKVELELPQGVLMEQVVEQVSLVVWGVLRDFLVPGRPDWLLYSGVGRAVHDRFSCHLEVIRAEPGGGRVLSLTGPATMTLTIFCAVLAHEILEPLEEDLHADSFPELAAEVPDAIEAALTPFVMRAAGGRSAALPVDRRQEPAVPTVSYIP